jgi:L-2-hydroxyglutarate oxidase LhgO
VPHRRLGKLIIATREADLDRLAGIMDRARDAGVELAQLDPDQAVSLEPALRCHGALLSDETGIIDSHAYMQALLGSAEAAGAQLVCGVHVQAVERLGERWAIRLQGDDAPTVAAPILVNAAGLGAQALAQRIEGLAPGHVPRLYLARGHYFAYAGRVPFSRLIYPVPAPGGLGTHLTLNLAGAARFGPDVEWIDAVDYHIDQGRHQAFATAASALWQDIDVQRLQPDFAGIRPKLCGPGSPDADFMVQGPDDHGLAGLINLFGIESPGLTASLSLAELICDRLSITQRLSPTD